MRTLVALPAFTDTYIRTLHDDARALVVDPGEAAPVHAVLDTLRPELAAILVTHHRANPVGGVAELRHWYAGAVLGAARERHVEATPEQMHASAQHLTAVRDDTRVCCTHEYTQSELRFDVAGEAGNRDIPTHMAWCADERSHGRPTLPSTIALEQRINSFLRADMATVATSARAQGAADDQPADLFAALREWKNRL